MTIEDVIRARLSSPTGATYPLVALQIHPNYLPDYWEMPAVMYERKSDPKQSPYNIDGTIDHIEATFKIHCYASQEESPDAQAIAQAVITDLEQYRASLDGITVNYVWFTNKYTDYDGINKRHRITVEMEFWYKDK